MAPSPGVLLRPVRPRDAEQFARWNEDDEVRRHYLGLTEQSAHCPISPQSERQRRGSLVLRSVWTPAGELIGWIELRDISWRRRSGELRVCLGAKHQWGRGLGSAAVAAFLSHAFSRWRLQEVYLRVATWNRRAIRAYEKCGFTRAGILRAGRREADGLEDLLLMTVCHERLCAALAER